ncbi:type II toxin-antitoxin system RelE/ParE family toxin [Thiolapillus brandeum]|uniref:Plasmid stabilization system toxin protein n=1 Tax=Thiolapillus brandeum TaxID=1076588 RepID=A0A7U6JL62_9GAMM|nr:type II toxin-antitoxin system RelE/ParE family toxin [Thiolapillus brandeum]BAO45595.1 plasmid stabilization system toxin protein [Thiolapillus brandeum]
MNHEILLTEGALQDLGELDYYIAIHDGPEKADYVLSKIEAAILELGNFPERGNYPPELSSLGIREYREIFFKPYRIIYRVLGKQVYIYLIVDGRRDMQALLARRLLK